MNSSSNTKRYTPTTTARPTWREREAMKERQQREAARRVIEEAERKKVAKTEENFPTMFQAPEQMRVFSGPSGRFVEVAHKMQQDEDTAAAKKKARARKVATDSAVLFVRSGTRRRDDYDDYDDYEDDDQTSPQEDLNEIFPPHGKRGTYSEPDYEGWRTVLKKTRKAPRELTEAELVKKYRETFFGEGEDNDEGVDLNGDLTERNQRREFY
jgi:hypothetical protein